MVGVPRSKGCNLCIKRRVKCDQVRPSCGNCIKYGAECPGYDRSLKFVANKHSVRLRGERKGTGQNPTSFETTLDFASSPASKSNVEALSPATPASAATIRLIPSPSPETTLGSIPSSLHAPTISIIHTMVSHLFTLHPHNEIIYTAPWFTDMLPYLGQTPVLDSSMCAFILQLVGRSKKNASDLCRSRDLYVASLNNLQRALNHPVAWRSTETLAATIMCSLFELFAGTRDPLTWMLHVSGMSKLIQQRGPASFQSMIDKALLRSARPLLITRDLFSGRDCFLDQPKWRRLSADLAVENSVESLHETSESTVLNRAKYHDRYTALFAKIPRIVRMGFYVSERDKIESRRSDPSKLREEAERLHKDVLSCYEDGLVDGSIHLPVEVPSCDPSSPFQTVYSFTSPWEGFLSMSHWATLLMLQECLNTTHREMEREHRPYTDNNKELATMIVRSLEYVGQGIMGPHRVGYPTRVAYDFLDEDLKIWTLSLVSRYNEQYAAISREIYPEHPALQTAQTAVGQAEKPAHAITWVD